MNETHELITSIREILARGRDRSGERVKQAERDLERIQKGQLIETTIR